LYVLERFETRIACRTKENMEELLVEATKNMEELLVRPTTA
jgi:hypothetical protein